MRSVIAPHVRLLGRGCPCRACGRTGSQSSDRGPRRCGHRVLRGGKICVSATASAQPVARGARKARQSHTVTWGTVKIAVCKLAKRALSGAQRRASHRARVQSGRLSPSRSRPGAGGQRGAAGGQRGAGEQRGRQGAACAAVSQHITDAYITVRNTCVLCCRFALTLHNS